MPCCGPYRPTENEIDEITNKILNFFMRSAASPRLI